MIRMLASNNGVKLLLPLAALLLPISGCQNGASDTAGAGSPAAATVVASKDEPEVLATVGEEEIRMSDLPAAALERLSNLETTYRQQRYDLLNAALNEEIGERLMRAEAEARGVSVAELRETETSTLLDPTDAEVEAWYAENRARLQGRSLDQLREQIREFLRQSQAEGQAAELDRRLREKYEVDVHLDPHRIRFDNEGHPMLGAAAASVTLVEFSDFECPFCSRFFPTLKRIEDEYGDRVNIVYRQFPIPSLHPAAFKAAEASLCAHAQDRFWAYHDLLFQEQDALTVRDLKEKAGRLGLDQAEFDRCLDTGRYTEQVQNDIAAGRAAGVTGTPALFVNGIRIPGGAVAFDSVANVLDAELARTAD